MASIREVAKLAGVSPATVSRVMNGTAKVDDEKRERVLQAISDTGFVPNAVARSLFKKSARIIGLIIPSITNPFFTQMASAIEKAADEQGYRLIFCNTGTDLEKEKASLTMLESMNADGIILTTSHEEIESYVNQCKVPVIVTDRLFKENKDYNHVHCDHYTGGRLAMEHLLDCGCKKIVCVKGPQQISSAKARYDGYRDVCEEKQVQEYTIDCDYDFNEGLVMTEQLLNQYPDVDGIIACNDMVALSIYKILRKNNIEVPEQIQLIGFDGIYLSNLLTPELTTIAQPIEEIGRKAAELIIHKEENDMGEKEYIFKPALVVRQTTKKKGEGE
ncbi:MAG: LacI family DNA-binding transcriptional regulator [Lachnospiraceae bacterium]|nr:LacI family DNA-binding transcriptional regulator [Lachnospiraceae bacterium]